MADTSYTLNGVSNSDTNMTASIELTKKTGTIIKLNTDNKYLTKDIWLTMSAQSGSATVTGTAVAEKATINNKDTSTVSGATNISGSLGNTTTTAPSSGYFICLTANAPATTLSMTKTINTSGWIDSISSISASASTTANTNGDKHYIPVTKAVTGNNGGDVVAYTTDGSNAGVNISSIITQKVNSEPTSGVYLAFTGSGSSKVTTAGYLPLDEVTTTGSSLKYFSIQQASITSSNANITSINFTYNSSAECFNVTGSTTINAPGVSQAGYISTTHGERLPGTAQLNNVTISKVGGGVNLSTGSGTGSTNITVTPSINLATLPNGVTDANFDAGNITTTAPNSGVYIAVASSAITGRLVATPAITTNGYGTSQYHDLTFATATYGANASSVTYIPIKEATVSVTGGAIENKTVSFDRTNLQTSPYNTSGISILPIATAQRGDISCSAITTGWVSILNNQVMPGGSSTAVETWTDTAPTYITGVELKAPTTAGATNEFDVIVPNGTSNNTITFHFIVDENGGVTITDGTT